MIRLKGIDDGINPGLREELNNRLKEEEKLTDKRLVRVFLLLAVCFLGITFIDSIPQDGQVYWLINLVSVIVDLTYFGTIHLILRKGGYYPKLRYLTFTLLVVMVTFTLIGHGLAHKTVVFSLRTSTTYLYFFMIALTAVYHDIRLSLYTGILVILNYSAIFLYGIVAEKIPFSPYETIQGPLFALPIWFFFCAVAALTSFAAAYAGHRYRRVLANALFSETSLKLAEGENRKRSFFFTNLAHETKTPLLLIDHYMERYRREHPEDGDLEIVSSNLKRLKRDMLNFLDHEKLISGRVFYDHSLGCDLTETLKTSLPLFRKYAAEKNISIKAVIGKTHGAIDPSAFDRVANNLLANAIRYNNDNGMVRVELKESGRSILFTVSDTGIGIPPEKLEHLFEPYYQLSHKKRNLEGMGIGLSIVKGIVDQVGGAISVDSEPGISTSVTVTLPRAEGTHKDAYAPTEKLFDSPDSNTAWAERSAPPPQDKGTTGEAVLIVEDNNDLRSLLALELSPPYDVRTAKDGSEAVEILSTGFMPDVIVSDIMMDGMDGEEFIRQVKGDQHFAHIPFIFITAKSLPEDRRQGLDLGAVDYIRKPFPLSDLKIKIGNILSDLSHERTRIKTDLRGKLDRLLEEEATNPREIIAGRFGLSAQEGRIMELLQSGKGYKEIAIEMNISINTAKTYIKRLYSKCSVSNKVELINLLANP